MVKDGNRNAWSIYLNAWGREGWFKIRAISEMPECSGLSYTGLSKRLSMVNLNEITLQEVVEATHLEFKQLLLQSKVSNKDEYFIDVDDLLESNKDEYFIDVDDLLESNPIVWKPTTSSIKNFVDMKTY